MFGGRCMRMISRWSGGILWGFRGRVGQVWWKGCRGWYLRAGHHVTFAKELASSGNLTGQTTRSLDSPCEGKTLSFALKLKNKNNGTNQTQIAKKAATSIKLGASSDPFVVLAPYLYLGCLFASASCAFSAKWKNQRKWSATTITQDKRNRGEVREMKGHWGVKLVR